MSDLHTHLHNYIWGLSGSGSGLVVDQSTPISTRRSAILAAMGASDPWKAIGIADLLLPPFRSDSKSRSSAPESKASKMIPKHSALELVVTDLNWMEEVEERARTKWNLETSDLTGKLEGWVKTKDVLDTLATYHSLFQLENDVALEVSESDTDARARLETVFLTPLYQLFVGDNKAIFQCIGQTPRLEGSGVVKPVLSMLYNQPPLRNICRLEDKSILVQIAHAGALENILNKPRSSEKWTATAESIVTQAYEGSRQTWENTIPHSHVVFIGNPGLWRMAYTINCQLVLSKWYSVDPEQAKNLLAEHAIDVHQGHLLRQKLALTVLNDPASFFPARSAHRSRPRTTAIVQSAIVRLWESTVDIWTRLCEVISQVPTLDLILDGPKVHTSILSMSAKFNEARRNMKPLSTVQDGKVWHGGGWYFKLPSGEDEIQATRESSKISGIVEYGALLEVTTGQHKGKIILVTAAAGCPIGDTQGLLDDLELHVRKDLNSCLEAINATGWHHHDVHPGDVVSDDGRITLVDFGEAMRASVCEASSTPCRDAEMMALLTISSSSSTETAFDALLSDNEGAMSGSQTLDEKKA